MLRHSTLIAVILLLLIPCSLQAQEILTTVQQGDTTKVMALLEADSSLAQFRDNAGRYPIHFAANSGNVPMIDLLVRYGADVHSATAAGTTTMHFAAFSGNLDAMKHLHELGVKLDIANGQGITPLYYAARFGHTPVVAYLIEQGADVNAVTGTGETTLHAACQSGSVETTELLLDAGVDKSAVDMLGTDALDFALQSGQEELAQSFLDQIDKPGQHRNEIGQNYLHAAAAGKCTTMISLLLARGVPLNDMDVYRMTPLDYARATQDCTLVAALEAIGAKRNKNSGKAPRGKYLGEKIPRENPELFAPGWVSTPLANERDIQFTRDGRELLFTRWIRGTWDVQVTRRDKRSWSEPQPLEICTPFSEAEAYLTRDEQRLFFISNRPDSSEAARPVWDLFFTTRTEDGWSAPKRLGDPFTGGYYTSFTNDGTMYLTLDEAQQRALPDGRGGFQDPERLPAEVNFVPNTYNSFIAPDESYLIYSAQHESSFGGGDMYINFRREDDSWTPAQNLGEKINSASIDYCPWVSQDGKAFFFSSRRYGNEDVFWVSASFLDDLKASAEF